MHTIIVGLTALAIGLLIYQRIARKGSQSHILRGISILFSTIVLVILVVILSVERGVRLDALLAIHISIGILFFTALGITCAEGIQLARGRKAANHKRWADLTLLLLIFTLATAFIAASAARKRRLQFQKQAITLRQ